MASVQEMIPRRLLRGAEVLGELWRSGVRCTTGGWGSTCSCSPPVDFCVAKRRWIDLYCALHGEEASWIRSNGGPFDLILAMSVRQFEATGITALVQVPGSEVPIRVGPDGTVWQTIADLGALYSTAEYDAALKDVLRVQRSFR